MGKGGHVRTVPVPDWVKSELEVWLAAAGIDRGKLFRRVNKLGKAWGEGMTVTAVWHIVKESAKCIGLPKLAPHDLRTCARLCHASGGELEQIQFLLGHVSVQTIALGSSRTLDVAELVVEGYADHPLASRTMANANKPRGILKLSPQPLDAFLLQERQREAQPQQSVQECSVSGCRFNTTIRTRTGLDATKKGALASSLYGGLYRSTR
jgi:hypothetical protein